MVLAKKLLTKYSNWEFWPSYITNIPIVGFWLWQAFKTRKLFFFSNVNPGTVTGGMLGNSKMGILKAIPKHLTPKGEIFNQNSPNRFQDVKNFMAQSNLHFPIILKPDIGERGLNVARIENDTELNNYLNNAFYDVIIQEYIDLPLEVTVFIYRIPDTEETGITSVCMKEFLFVRGDGIKSIHELILDHERGRLYEDVLEDKWKNKWNRIPSLNEMVFLQPIGNHCKGTKFINANHMIDQEMIDTFSKILRQMDGFYYGRFDIRSSDWSKLKSGEGIKIMEFNGVNSEPAHVYDPNYGFINRYKTFYHQWSLMARIHRAQVAKGIEPLKWSEAWSHATAYRNYLKLVK